MEWSGSSLCVGGRVQPKHCNGTLPCTQLHHNWIKCISSIQNCDHVMKKLCRCDTTLHEDNFYPNNDYIIMHSYQAIKYKNKIISGRKCFSVSDYLLQCDFDLNSWYDFNIRTHAICILTFLVCLLLPDAEKITLGSFDPDDPSWVRYTIELNSAGARRYRSCDPCRPLPEYLTGCGLGRDVFRERGACKSWAESWGVLRVWQVLPVCPRSLCNGQSSCGRWSDSGTNPMTRKCERGS